AVLRQPAFPDCRGENRPGRIGSAGGRGGRADDLAAMVRTSRAHAVVSLPEMRSDTDFSQPFSTWSCSTANGDPDDCQQGGGMMRLRVDETERTTHTDCADGLPT